MPTRADMEAAAPKCPCQRVTGPEQQRCAEPMTWDHDAGCWVCPRHPHMMVVPGDLDHATLAPKARRDAILGLS